jgi:ribonuclease P/MRP protein subunit RPP40
MESLIRDEIIQHLEKWKVINNSQHGFVRNRSCLTNLLIFLEEVSEYIDSGYLVDVLYLDFQKAFDKVPHHRLISKVKAHGINGKVAEWISNWLSRRKQRVVINGKVSGWKSVVSGVPQGSVLGPLLFVIYINDIDDNIQSKVLKFADDTKVYRHVHSGTDIDILRSDLVKSFDWSKEWRMLFNIDKCKIMHIGYNNPNATYSVDSIDLSSVDEEKDLDVVITKDFKAGNQCGHAVKKAKRMLGTIKRNFTDRSRMTIVALYKSLVRPHLEYCIQAWRPHLSKDIQLVERVQRRATKMVEDIKHLSYNERMTQLGLSKLETRQIKGDVIETFKILKGIDSIDYNKFFQMNVGWTREHSLKLVKKVLD